MNDTQMIIKENKIILKQKLMATEWYIGAYIGGVLSKLVYNIYEVLVNLYLELNHHTIG